MSTNIKGLLEGLRYISQIFDSKGSRKENSSCRDLSDIPKSSRRRSSKEGSSDSPKKKDSSSRGKSRRHSKDSSEGSGKSSRQHQEVDQGSTDSSSSYLPEIPKKSRRMKSKESISGGSTQSRVKGSSSSNPGSPCSEPNQTSSVKPVIEEDQDKKNSDGC
ncbi:unnamed protein product [Fraxinus pennsylvanica]|uniref:Uncharacterized protein n=1 Tax=Fraxinus pennsylvanica TaxID=56036 RepID=A0AAD2E0T6_9LAMI|nr:unnamed protein product [Fraxinus pennsylvanica]